MSQELASLTASRKTGNEPFNRSDGPLETRLLGFWQWAMSNLLVNTTRGILAEYLVALDIGLADGVRGVWDAFDLMMPDGIKIEVKSGAYVQDWSQTQLSRIAFSIAPARQYDNSINDYGPDRVRPADIYVFALLNHQDKLTVDPLNLEQWTFYVLATRILDEKYPTQDTIGLASLLSMNPIVARFGEIGQAVYRVLAA